MIQQKETLTKQEGEGRTAGVMELSAGVGELALSGSTDHPSSALRPHNGAHCREWIYAVAGTYGSSFFIFNFDLDVTSISNMDWF